MNDATELAQRYVSVWNESDPAERRRIIRDLWTEDGMECTRSRPTKGYSELEARIAASHEKNVLDAQNRFVLQGKADRNHDVVKLDWRMIQTKNGLVKATGSYLLFLNVEGKILSAYFFADTDIRSSE
jgi:hypothetical protein